MYVFILLTTFSTVLSFNLTIIHTNDVHAHYEEMNKYGGQCRDDKCFGGMPRLKYKVDQIRNMYPNTLFLDAGDQYQGTLWFTHHGGQIVHTYMNILGYDVMALGNHEFDLGPSGLLTLLDNAGNMTILSCNTDTTREPSLQNKISKHVVIDVGGEKIGVIGYTTKDTAIISNPRDVIFLDEIESIRNEVKILQNKGVNKIIAVGHAGYKVDKRIANEVSGIDVVVGGHSNTFLYTGPQPSSEVPVNIYPTVITTNTNEQVLVVQDYTFAKYLGFLQVTFDDDGKITDYHGNPILLDNTIPKDEYTQNVTNDFGKEVAGIMNDVIGRSLVKLEGDRYVCRLEECNMGNLVADGMVHQNLLHADNIDGTKVFISLVNSGAVRASMERGNITVGLAIATQPFRNTIETIRLRGDYLLQVLERSVEMYDPEDPSGGFLQYSGIHVTYDMSKPAYQRVVEAWAICQNCSVPTMQRIDKKQMYHIVLSYFILNGGDGYTIIRDHAERVHVTGNLDSDVFIEYIQNISPIYKGREGRIRFVDQTKSEPCGQTSSAILCSGNIVSLWLLFTLLLFVF